MYACGKFLKYSIWASFALYIYHLYLVFNKEKPEDGFGTNELFLEYAWWTRIAYRDLKELLTMPPARNLLGELPPLPPGY
jgi:hypothetical protein